MALLWRSVGIAAELHARRTSTAALNQLRLLSTSPSDPSLSSVAEAGPSNPAQLPGSTNETEEKVLSRKWPRKRSQKPKAIPFAPLPPVVRPALIPAPKGKIVDVASFLDRLRRPVLAEAASKFTDWNDLFSKDGKGLEAAGLQPKDRKYLLWCMQLFRKGRHPHYFAFHPKGKKKIRGWGPRVQNGIRRPPHRNSN